MPFCSFIKYCLGSESVNFTAVVAKTVSKLLRCNKGIYWPYQDGKVILWVYGLLVPAEKPSIGLFNFKDLFLHPQLR